MPNTISDKIKGILQRNSNNGKKLLITQTPSHTDLNANVVPKPKSIHKHISSHHQLFNLLKDFNQQPWKLQ
jgi:hypothetical protein